MKKIIYSFLGIALLASCTAEEDVQMSSEVFADKVTINSKPFEFDGDSTRTVLTNTGSKIEFGWRNGEAIGIFPVAPTTNIQAKQVLRVSENCTSATFDGAGWALKRGNTYAAYSPFNENATAKDTYDRVPINVTGQVQNGNNNLEHIGDGYDYMYGSASVPTEGGVNFEFNHVCAIAILELTMPEAGTWTSATLTASSNVFTTSATMNVSTGTVTSVRKSNSVSLALTNVSTTVANQIITLYMSVLPTTTGTLTLEMKNNADKKFTATLATKTLAAGKAYKWIATTKKTSTAPSNAKAVDLGLSVKWANMNVGSETVTDYGKYYAWGEIKGFGEYDSSNSRNYSSSGSYARINYNWSTYKWGIDESGNSFSKYTLSTVRTLALEDDAAAVNWGGDWRMPTFNELCELTQKCYWVWTDSYNGSNKAGYIVYKVLNEADKGKVVKRGGSSKYNYTLSKTHIFLPAAGDVYDSSVKSEGSYGFYGCSEIAANAEKSALQFYFYYNDVNIYFINRCYGQSIRAVCP